MEGIAPRAQERPDRQPSRAPMLKKAVVAGSFLCPVLAGLVLSAVMWRVGEFGAPVFGDRLAPLVPVAGVAALLILAAGVGLYAAADHAPVLRRLQPEVGLPRVAAGLGLGMVAAAAAVVILAALLANLDLYRDGDDGTRQALEYTMFWPAMVMTFVALVGGAIVIAVHGREQFAEDA